MWLLVLVLLPPSIVGNWTTVVVYDVLPEGCRGRIFNNDVGNPRGDMYFNIKDKYLPLACEACKTDPRGCQHDPSTFDCTNPESSGDLVVRKLQMEIQRFSDVDYKLCDVWPGSPPCAYTCFGQSKLPTRGVGRELVCGGDKHECNMAPAPSSSEPYFEPWDYWNYNLAALVGNTGGGEWYSLVGADQGKWWRRPTIVKTINARCQALALEALVQQTGQSCFGLCPQPTNQTSACWINCFFATVLGPGANSTLKPPGHQQGAMDLGDLEQAWLAGFASDDPAKGGCPPCPNDGPCSELEPLATAAAPVRRAPRQYAF